MCLIFLHKTFHGIIVNWLTAENKVICEFLGGLIHHDDSHDMQVEAFNYSATIPRNMVISRFSTLCDLGSWLVRLNIPELFMKH